LIVEGYTYTQINVYMKPGSRITPRQS